MFSQIYRLFELVDSFLYFDFSTVLGLKQLIRL